MARKKPPEMDVSTAFQVKLKDAVTRPTINNYVPHEKQLSFHKGTQQQKLYVGGNRSGKTVGGIVEDVYWLRGQHPYRRLPMAPGTPCRGRIVSVSFTEGVKGIIIPELLRWIVPSDLINGSWEDSYNQVERKLTFANGATVELMSYDQATDKFAGTSRHFIHFDEEPPKAVFNECKLRLLDTGGSWWMTMTPVEGMTWVHRDIYSAGLENLLIVQIAIDENPYVSASEIDTALSGLSENEMRARRKGEFVALTGLVFKEFDPEQHVIKFLEDPQRQYDKLLRTIYGWSHYVSMDHGLANPSAWLWHAVSPGGAVVTYDELYDNERLVNEYAIEVHQRNARDLRRAPDIYVADPATKQRNAQTGDSIQTAYAMAGIPMVMGNNDVRIGADKMNRYLKSGKWVITENCHNLIRELQTVRWKAYETIKKRDDNNPREEIHKKDDHAPDSARYFFSLMPDLSLPREPVPPNTANLAVQSALGALTVPVGPYYVDERLLADLKRGNRQTEWTVQDEYMGGLF